MKQIVGLVITLACVPLLVFIQNQIQAETVQTETLQASIRDAVKLDVPVMRSPIQMKDRNGKLFAEEYVEWRRPIDLQDMTFFTRQLFLKSEDRTFYEHRGYDIAAIIRAFTVNAAADDKRQGASTITQQVVRLRYLSTEKTYERKFKELFLAAELEKQSTKDEILEMYLNEMYFGNQVYGIGGAATYYFSRPLEKLNEAEIAFLAAIPNNPSLYNPIKHFDKTKERQVRLLRVLTDQQVITPEQFEEYRQLPITLHVKKKEQFYPMYSSYVLEELKELIAQTEGLDASMQKARTPEERQRWQNEINRRTRDVISKGVTIETALDPSKQQHDENRLNALIGTGGVQAGAAVIDNEMREIISLYAGSGYKKTDFNRAYQAVRQPGSAIKPFLVYAPFFESGPYHADTPVNSSNICIGGYCPTNFGNYQFGTTSVREAFRNSYNTTAVRLLQRVGIDTAFAHLEPFHFRHFVEADRTYPAALGGFSKGVTPLELAGAATGFIDGMYIPPRAIRSVKDSTGEVLYKWKDTTKAVWSPSTVSSIRSLMQEVVLNGTGEGIAHTTGYTGAKTGTTDSFKDLWAVGMNDRYTSAVWIGYDRPKPIPRLRDQKIHLRAFSSTMRP
ncbi:penicillin-binding protein [Sporosarcina sp. P37]|uniref:transglycosylase domain-containing protein n=1 Tax=unclassified Sporosarcina TaxID=2647733 RepID=UPI0009C18D17|nr:MULTISPECIES: transglycosylase domain-containing protein [unclassified Sporosarcina]ARD47426.1 penicillin-binding protein [Sporosarcina sp. P33]ARK23996.1 penicillin-binding protein [Sporosarcina sp. P37]PID17190.1 penicillin-binding protein [Sporosarcina sp. P35]